jgi:hypothetical protein
LSHLALLPILASTLLLITACPEKPGPSSNGSSSAPVGLYGKWTRQTSLVNHFSIAGLYVANAWVAVLDDKRTITGDALDRADISAAGTDFIEFELYGQPYRLTLDTEYAAVLSGGGSTETLFRFLGERTSISATAMRASTSATAMRTVQTEAEPAPTARALGMSGAAGVRMVIRNVNNTANQPPERTSDSSGDIQVPQIILGEEYTVQYTDTQAGNTTYNFTIAPTEMNQDIGNLISTGASGMGLKLMMDRGWGADEYLYALLTDPYDEMDFAHQPYPVSFQLLSTGAQEPASGFTASLLAGNSLFLAARADPSEPPPLIADDRWVERVDDIPVEGFTTGLAYLGEFWLRYTPPSMLDDLARSAVTMVTTLQLPDTPDDTDTVTVSDRLPLTFYRGERSIFELRSDAVLDYFLIDPDGRSAAVGRLDGANDSIVRYLPYRAGSTAPDGAYTLTLRRPASTAASATANVHYGFSLSAENSSVYFEFDLAAQTPNEAESNDSIAQVVEQGSVYYGVLSTATDIDRFAFKDSSFQALLPTDQSTLNILNLDDWYTIYNQTPTFRWPGSPLAISYSLQIGQPLDYWSDPDPDGFIRVFTGIAGGSGAIEYTVPSDQALPLNDGGGYSFRVKAHTAQGDSVWSIWSWPFMVGWPLASTAPSGLQYLPDGPSLVWDALGDADGYVLQFKRGTDFLTDQEEWEDGTTIAQTEVTGTTEFKLASTLGGGSYPDFALTGATFHCRVFAFKGTAMAGLYQHRSLWSGSVEFER